MSKYRPKCVNRDEISWRGRAWSRNQWVQFWWRSGSRSGSRSPKSEIRIHCMDYRKSYQRILMKFYGELECSLETNWLHFGVDPQIQPPLLPKSITCKFHHVPFTANFHYLQIPLCSLYCLFQLLANSTPFSAKFHYLQFQRPQSCFLIGLQTKNPPTTYIVHRCT